MTCQDRRDANAALRQAERFEARNQELAGDLIQQLDQLVPPSQLLELLESVPESIAEAPDILLDGSAISEVDKEQLKNCCEKLMNITMEHCTSCNEEWFDLDVKDGCCTNCRKSTKYMASNLMDPGPGWSDLPPLTQMEELLISPTHALVQLWQIRGGQTKYKGHICNFSKDVASFHRRLPLLPEECDIVVLCWKGFDKITNRDIFEDFCVRREVVTQWLLQLQEHHPSFTRTGENPIMIDPERLLKLPENDLVHDHIREIVNEQLEEQEPDILAQGPQDDSLPVNEEGIQSYDVTWGNS